MKHVRLIVVSVVCWQVHTVSAAALPTMIRLGYTDCATCHVSPQGGGLLTTYGKGIDAAQSFLQRDLPPDERQRRLLYDVRFVTGGSLRSSAQAPDLARLNSFRMVMRGMVTMSSHTRVSYEAGVDTPPLTRMPASAGRTANAVIGKALLAYRPRNGVEVAAGRDALPNGLGLPDTQRYMERQHDPLGTGLPTQVKAFLWTDRLQVTPYVFGPGFDEAGPRRQRGAGVVGGVDVWKRHAVLGMSARMSQSDAADRRSIGAFARLGFGRWGILAEHDVTSRVTARDAMPEAQYVTGYTQLFVAPVEWFVTSLVVDNVVSTGPGAKRTYRIAPTAQVRFSDNYTVQFSTRDDFAIGAPPNSRTYSITLAVKTVQ